MAYSFYYKMDKASWNNAKKWSEWIYTEVPNTAKGYECCCKNISDRFGNKWLLTAHTEVDYAVHVTDGPDKIFMPFRIEKVSEDKFCITIEKCTHNKRTYTAAKFLKKYIELAVWMACAVVLDKAVIYKPYRKEWHEVDPKHYAAGLHFLDVQYGFVLRVGGDEQRAYYNGLYDMLERIIVDSMTDGTNEVCLLKNTEEHKIMVRPVA